jgi:hypothetical protein
MKDPKEVIARLEYAVAFAECTCADGEVDWCEKCDLQDALDLIETLYAFGSYIIHNEWAEYMTREEINKWIKEYPQDIKKASKHLDSSCACGREGDECICTSTHKRRYDEEDKMG